MKRKLHKNLMIIGTAALLMTACGDNEQPKTDEFFTIEVVASSVKYSGGTFLEQAKALYMVNELAIDSSSLQDKIKTCRLSSTPKDDCKRFLTKMKMAVDAFNASKHNTNKCDDFCKLYRTSDLLLSQDIEKLADEVVVFSAAGKLKPTNGSQ
jgi:hypothetical protein